MGVAGESMPCFKGGDYDPGTVHCGELCYARGHFSLIFFCSSVSHQFNS